MRFLLSPLFLSALPLLGLSLACSQGSGDRQAAATGGAGPASGGGGTASGGFASGGQPALATGGMPTGGAATGGNGGVLTGSGGMIEPSSGGGSGLAPASGGAGGGTGGQTTGGSGGAAGGSSGGQGSGGGGASGGGGGELNLESFAAELDELLIHDACTGVQAQEDTCTHVQLIERALVFGGDPEKDYIVTLRVRGLFEPTNISGGTAPLAQAPYFVVGGAVNATDYSQWQIEVSAPAEVYTLNHYPQTSHTIYQEDFQAEIIVSGGSAVTVRVADSNDRQIDNGYVGLPDRQQVIDGVTDGVLDGQILRLDVVSVELKQ